MTGIFNSDERRAMAADLRRLMIRLQNSDPPDVGLGPDIRDVLNAPATIRDPLNFMDDALWLADFLSFDRVDVLAAATKALREKVRAGWKAPFEISNADAARAITSIVLKGHIARLEGVPV